MSQLHFFIIITATSGSGHDRVGNEMGTVSQKIALSPDSGGLRAGSDLGRVLEDPEK